MQNWKTSDFQEVLKYNGYSQTRCKGDHLLYTRPNSQTIAITVGHVNGCIAYTLIKNNNLELPIKLQHKYTTRRLGTRY